MSLLNLLNARKNAARRNVARRHLCLELLEGRQLLSTFTVTNANDSGAGSLRQAIIGADGAADAATINFAITGSNKTITLESALPQLSNTHGMTWNGESGAIVNLANSKLPDGNSVMVDSLASVTINDLEFENAPGRAFENDGNLTLSGVTVTGSHNGAAVNYGTMNITGSTIENNTAVNYGGGVNNYSGTLTVTDSTFSGNKATYGGAIDNGGGLTISNSSFTGNTASDGGALLDDGTSATTISSSTVTGNVGVGLFNDGSRAMKLTNDNIYANKAPASVGTSEEDITGSVDPTSSGNLIGNGFGMTGIVDNNPFNRSTGTKSGQYNSAKPANFIGSAVLPSTTVISPDMTQTVTLDGVTLTYDYTVRTNSATMTISGKGTKAVSLGSIDGDNADGPVVYPNHFAIDLLLTDPQNGESGSISLWENYDATELSAPTLKITNNKGTNASDAIADLTNTWVDDNTGITTTNTWSNGVDTKKTKPNS